MRRTDPHLSMEIYTPEEAAEKLKVATCTIWELCRKKKIGFSKVGRMYRITDEDIKKFLENNKG